MNGADHEHPLVGLARKLATEDERSRYVFSREAIVTLETLLLDGATAASAGPAILGLFGLARGLHEGGSHEGARALVELVGRVGPKRLEIRRRAAMLVE